MWHRAAHGRVEIEYTIKSNVTLVHSPFYHFPPTSHRLRLLHRYTNVDDTVLGIGVETTAVAEEAIDKGRCVEFFVLDEDKRDMLKTNIANAFRTAHSRGLFQVPTAASQCPLVACAYSCGLLSLSAAAFRLYFARKACLLQSREC